MMLYYNIDIISEWPSRFFEEIGSYSPRSPTVAPGTPSPSPATQVAPRYPIALHGLPNAS